MNAIPSLSAGSRPTTNPSVATDTAQGRNDPHADRVAQLSAAANQAAEIRELSSRPEIVALRIDRIRTQVDGMLWIAIGLGLLFTAVNVQHFAAAGAPAYSVIWWVAWLLDPMVSLVLLAVLRAEQVTARYQVPLGAWARRTKWCAFAVTYLMNTWSAWGLADAPLSVPGVVLHSVPPLLVVFAAETGPALREGLATAARRTASVDGPSSNRDDAGAAVGVHERSAVCARDAWNRTPRESGAGIPEPSTPRVRESPARPRRAGADTDRPRAKRRPSAPRRLLADYLAEARSAVEEAMANGQVVDITPTWCRNATGCSAGTSVKLAAALRDGPAR